jgi:predicted Ser/Thr protein kinase
VKGSIGSGRMGDVYCCQWCNQGTVLKLVDIQNPTAKSALAKEIKVYHDLEDVQGLYIPKVLFYSVISPSGNMEGFGLQQCQDMPNSFSKWTSGQRNPQLRP